MTPADVRTLIAVVNIDGVNVCAGFFRPVCALSAGWTFDIEPFAASAYRSRLRAEAFGIGLYRSRSRRVDDFDIWIG